MAPTLLLAVLSPLVFWLPAASGEKVSLGVTLMLTFVFLLSILMAVLPRSSLHTALLVAYLLLLCACSALSVLLTVLVLSLHHRPASLPLTATAAGFVRFLARRGCIRLLLRGGGGGCCNEAAGVVGVVGVGATSGRSRATVAPSVGGVQSRAQPDSDAKAAAAGPTRCEADHGDLGRGHGRPAGERSGSAEMTWRDVAAGCDYVFSRLFLAVIFVASVVCFVVMTAGKR